MIKSVISILLFTIVIGNVLFAQADRREVRRGNNLFRAEKFDEAEIKYRRALEENPQNLVGLFNLGNSLYRQGRFEEAAEVFESLAQISPSPRDRAQALHNLGNSHLKNQKLQESIDAFKSSLRINPNANETRHNLAYAMRLLQDQPPQGNGGEGDDNQDKDNKQDQENSSQQDNNQQNQPQRQQHQPGQISPQDAERILNALNKKEQNIQEELNRQQQRSPERHEREW